MRRILFIILIWTICFIWNKGEAFGSCGPPANLRVSSVTLQNANFQWNDFNATAPIFWELRLIDLSSVTPDTVYFSSIFVKTFNVTSLLPNNYYEVSVRSYCGTDGFSIWSNYVRFYTHLTNPSKCNMSLPIENNNCSNLFPQKYFINVNNVQGTELGVNAFIDSIGIIVDHSFPSDLNISLSSPSGKTVRLIQNRGVAAANFGIPNQNQCQTATTLLDHACKSLSQGDAPYIGHFKPEESLSVLYDTTNPNGIWVLSFCDDHPSDLGFLDYFSIHFGNSTCPPISDIFPLKEQYHSISIEVNRETTNPIIFEYGGLGFVPGTGSLAGSSSSTVGIINNPDSIFTANGLFAERTFEVYARKQCGSTFSINSCPIQIETLCEDIAIDSDFEAESLCTNECGVACNLVGFWKNAAGDDTEWLVTDATQPNSVNTGPQNDRRGRGKYIFLETRDPACQNGKRASLVSQCFLLRPNIGNCHLSFYYFMFGAGVNSLNVEISIDEGRTWTSLWSKQGEQGYAWYKQFINLQSYIGQIVQVRFVGITGDNALGDIALDDIYLYKNTTAVEDTYIYFKDKDRDTYGDAIDTLRSCLTTPPQNYVANALDCDDNNSLIRPNRTEVQCNLIDENCNGMADDDGSNLTYATVNFINETCDGLKRGVVEIQPMFGTPPYLVAWNNNVGGNRISQLKAGDYQATITDASGCKILTEVFTVNLVSSFAITVNFIKPSSCSGRKDGEISVTTTIGSNNTSFFWSSGQSWPYLQAISDGMYTVTVFDNLGCKEVMSNIVVPTTRSMDVQVLDYRPVTCVGHGNGSIKLSAFGGTAPYTYWWSNNFISQTNQPLHPGTYSVTIYDADECHIKREYTITGPDTLKIKLLGIDPVVCQGKNNGAIFVDGTGGTAPYSFIWTDADKSYVTKNLINIGAGDYTVKVFDANGCTATLNNIRIGETPNIQIFIDSIHDVACQLSQDGYVKVRAVGGYQPIRYQWTNGVQDSVLRGIPAGSYGINAIDRLGCKEYIYPIEIRLLNQGLSVQVLDRKNAICYGDLNTFVAVSSSGTLPLNFHWNSGRNVVKSIFNDTLKNINRGIYALTVTDGKGCTGQLTNISINGPESPISYQIRRLSNPNCYYSQDGFIDLRIDGGVLPYRYIWTNGAVAEDIYNLAGGQYKCTITDGLGCLFSTPNIPITSPDSMKISFALNKPNIGQNNGWVEAQVTGGTPTYFYQWDMGANNQQNARAINLSSGQYWLTVLDSKGCREVVSIFLPLSTATKEELDLQKSISIFPSPNRGSFTIYFEDNVRSYDISKIEVYSSIGVKVLSDLKFNFPSCEYTLDLPNGIYYLNFVNTRNMRIFKSLIINR